MGQHKKVKVSLFSDVITTLQKQIDEKKNEGYEEFDKDKLIYLDVECKIDDFGTGSDLGKRNEAMGKLDHILGWTGMGYVDGGSIGSGTMEVGCTVVDFDIAKTVIEQQLKGTE